MPDDIDFSEFLPKTPTPVAPLPSVSQTPVAPAPGGGVDFSEFLPTAPPAPSSPGSNIAKWLGPAPAEPVGPVQTQETKLSPSGMDFQATKVWYKLENERKALEAERAAQAATGHRGKDGGPESANIPLDPSKYPTIIALGNAPAATFSQLQNTMRQSAGLPGSLPSRGLGASFAAGLGSGVDKLAGATGWKPGVTPELVQQQDEADAANFAAPGYFEQAAESLGATAPALVGAIATRGRTMPFAGSMAIPAEAAVSNYAMNAATDPNLTPVQNLSQSLIEGLMTRVGGKFEPGIGKTPLAELPGKIAGETLEEGATSGLQSVSDQVLDPNGNGSVDLKRVKDEAIVGGLAGSMAASTLSGPGAIVDRVKSDAAFMNESTPKPRPYTYRYPLGRMTAEDAVGFDLAKADSRRAIAAEDAKLTPEELAAKRADEASFDNLTEADMTGKVPDAVDALANNTPAPNDGGTQDYQHFFGKPDNSQQETRNDLAPDIQPPRTLGSQFAGELGRQDLANKETKVFTPEDLARQKAQVIQANDERVHQEVLDSQAAGQDAAPIKPANPKTEETKLDLAPVKDKALSDAEAYINTLPADEQASAKDALVGWDHKADPLGYKGNIEMLKGRKELAARKAQRLAAAAKAPVAPAPGPVQEAADFNHKQGEYVSPPASTDAPPVRKQLERGAKKGPALVDQHLGKPGFKSEGPGNFVTRPVRLFTDAGQHPMSVQAKGVGGYHIAWDPARNKAVITAKTDTKGRKAEKGTEWRPVDANGNVQMLDSGKVTLYSSVEAAVKAMAPLTKAAEPAVNVAVKGRDAVAAVVPDDTTDPENPANQTAQDTAPARKVATDAPEVGDTVDQAPKKGAEVLAAEAELHGVEKELKALGARASSLSEEELNHTDALEAKAKDLKATIAAKTADASASEKAKENSPLTPKIRMGLSKVLGADKVKTMTPREVGEVVRKTLHLANDMQPTQDEVGRAIRDLEANGVLEKGQAIIPGDSIKAHAFNGGNLFSDPHEAKIVGIAQQALGVTKAQVLENAISDIPLSQSAQVQEINGPKTTRLGHMTSTVIHHLTRALGITGPIGAGIEQFVARLHLQNAADWVARLHPEFRPTLSAIREQMDQTKKERYEAYHRLDELKDLKGEEKLHVRGALVSFRLEGVDGRKAADFGDPVKYTDPKGRVHTYTLTPKELDVVKSVYAANRKLLQDQVDTMLSILGLPSNLTIKDLSTGLANGSIKPSARLVEPALRAIEEGSESYVPLMRTGNRVIRVYDQAKYNAAKNSKERKDALLQTSNASTLQQERKITDAAIHRFPTAHITVDHGDAMDSTTGITGISEKDLLDLAEASGISYGVLQQFMAGGISDYFATRGTKARFVAANRLEGFNHDMYQANVAHAMQMTNSTMALKYGKMVENSITKKAIPDDRLRLYASRFADSMAAPASPVAGSVKSAITYWYLANNLASAAINGTASFIKGVMLPTLLSTSPVPGVKAFLEGSKQMARASLAILGRGHLGKWSGKSQVQLAIDGWKGVSPGLSKALEDADHAGHLQGKYDIDAEEIAKYGEPSNWGKTKKAAFALGLHAFSSVEKANRIAASVVGYKLWESSMALKGARKDAFIRMAHELNMDTSSAAKFMVDYSNSINFRNDKTESPSIARGVFDVNNKFHNLAPAQIAYSMHNYAMNETVSQVSYARAAWKAGWIPRATYAALMASAIMAFGSLHTVVGAPLASKAYHSLTGHLETLEQEGKDQGGIRRVLTTGGAGTAANALLGKRYGDYVDQIVKRANNANAIPDSLDPSSNIAAVGMVKSIANAVGDIRSEVPERKIRGYAALAGKGVAHAVEYAQAAAEGAGKMTSTGSTAVAGPDKAAKGSPVLGALDYAAGMLGLTPPVVGDAYDRVKLIDEMKKSNDHELDVVVNGLASSFDIKDPAASREASGEFLDRLATWNKKAVALDRLDMYITDGMLKLALMAELSNRANGAFDLKKVPKAGRIEALRQQAAQVSQDNIKE